MPDIERVVEHDPVNESDGTIVGGRRYTASPIDAKTYISIAGTEDTTGDTDLVAAVTGKRIKFYSRAFTTQSTSAVTVILKSKTTGTVLFKATFQAISGSTSGISGDSVTPPAFLGATVAGEALTINLSGNIAVDYSISYWADDSV